MYDMPLLPLRVRGGCHRLALPFFPLEQASSAFIGTHPPNHASNLQSMSAKP